MQISKLFALGFVNVAAAFALLSPAVAATNIVETAAQNGSFTTLLAAVEAAGMVDALKSDGPLTVFAPTDEAFSKLPDGTVAELLKPENASKLQAVLKYHVVAGTVMSSEAAQLDSAPTLLGQMVSITPNGEGLYIDNAAVVAADIEASNGVIHVIDSVLLPRDIMGVAAEAGTFNTLAAAIEAAGLGETLSSGGPFTVFAPTDEAFAKLPAGTVDELLKPENIDQLRAVLTYHVVPGVVMASDVTSLSEAPTVNGSPLWINADANMVTVSGAEVVATDIQAFNGVVHVINAVMLPPADTATATANMQASSSCGH